MSLEAPGKSESDVEESQAYGQELRLYVGARAVSVVGDRLATIALVFLVIHLSHAYAPALALYYLCTVLPSLVGGLLAGVIADHFERRRLMVGCDLARALVVLAIPSLGSLGLWTIYPAVVALYGLTMLFDATAQAAIPDLVPSKRMLSANAILNGIETGGDFAYAAGGLLVFTLGLATPFYVDVATFVISGLLVATMRFPAHISKPWPKVRSVWSDVREGLDYLFAQPFLKWTTFTFSLAPFAGGIVFVLTPLYANRVLQGSPDLFGPLRNGAFRFSILEVSLGMGALAGSVLIERIARVWPGGKRFGAGVAGFGVACAALGFVSNFYLAALLVAVAGLFNSLFAISGMTLVQALTPSSMRGRVFAARLTVINGSLAVGTVAGGWLLLSLDYSTTWLLAGGMIILASAFVWLRPNIRNQA